MDSAAGEAAVRALRSRRRHPADAGRCRCPPYARWWPRWKAEGSRASASRRAWCELLSAKERLGLDRKRFVDVESIGDVIDDPAVNERAQEIAERAVTLVRNGGNMLPLAAPDRTCFVTMTESRYSVGWSDFLAGGSQAVAQGRTDRARWLDDRAKPWTTRCRSCRPVRSTPSRHSRP